MTWVDIVLIVMIGLWALRRFFPGIMLGVLHVVSMIITTVSLLLKKKGDEFHRTGISSAKSAHGFTVALAMKWLEYTDANDTVRMDTESLWGPKNLVVYAKGNIDMKAMSADRAREVMSNIMRALEFLGKRVKLD
jgi:hypothetical protein